MVPSMSLTTSLVVLLTRKMLAEERTTANFFLTAYTKAKIFSDLTSLPVEGK
jgi:hypothetical protein